MNASEEIKVPGSPDCQHFTTQSQQPTEDQHGHYNSRDTAAIDKHAVEIGPEKLGQETSRLCLTSSADSVNQGALIMSDAPTYESTLKYHGLTNEQMQGECDESVILALVPKMEGWRNIAPHLKVDGCDVDAISKDTAIGEEGKRRKLLERWKGKFGHEATLERLACSFSDSRHVALADIVCEERKKMLPTAGEFT